MNTPLKIVKALFNEYKDINTSVKNINWGGCGIFAEQLYKTLLKLGIETKLAVITNDARQLKRRIKNKPYKNEPLVQHVVVRLGKKLIDSEGIYNKPKDINFYYDNEIAPIPLAVLSKWNKKADFWKDYFNRKDIKTIKTKLAESRKKVKKDLVVSN
jgi:hypothetical protein